MIEAPRMEQWSEDMDSEITLVLEFLGERMKYLEINGRTGGQGVGVWISELSAIEDKREWQWNEVAYWIDGMDMFARGRWLRLLMEYVDFAENNI